MVEQSSCLEFEDIRAVNKRIILKWVLKYGLNSSESGLYASGGLICTYLTSRLRHFLCSRTTVSVSKFMVHGFCQQVRHFGVGHVNYDVVQSN